MGRASDGEFGGVRVARLVRPVDMDDSVMLLALYRVNVSPVRSSDSFKCLALVVS